MSDIESREDYRDMIETMADVIEDEYEGGDELSEIVWENVDSSRPSMYTNDAIAALRYSRNGPGEWEPFVADDSSWQAVVRAMAFSAVRADLWEELDYRGLN